MPGPPSFAVLEHDLLGVPPATGVAHMQLVLRRAGTCFAHDPIADLTESGRAHCGGCGRPLHLDEAGSWSLVEDRQSLT
ncbi:hypothetical protein GTY68_22530 [Streptomyces sp. SID4926]|nr:hypothetical protein [Streptomyces sp. SID4926]